MATSARVPRNIVQYALSQYGHMLGENLYSMTHVNMVTCRMNSSAVWVVSDKSFTVCHVTMWTRIR